MATVTSTTVTVELGPDPRLVRVARLAARSMASDAGFHLDALEDLSLAIDELSACAIVAMAEDARLRIHIDTDDMGIVARAVVVGAAEELVVEDLTTSILENAVDRWSVNDGDIAFRLVKVRPGLA